MIPSPVRIGIVPYLNARPLLLMICRKLPAFFLTTLPPSQLAVKLSNDEVDIALLSSVEYFRHPDYVIVGTTGIASRGEVRSIKLLLGFSLEGVSELVTDAESLTANVMAAVLLRESLQRPVRLVGGRAGFSPRRLKSHQACVLIGDKALQVDHPKERTIDLGAMWSRLFRQPFVYALWLAKRQSEISEELARCFSATPDELRDLIGRAARGASSELSLSVQEIERYLSSNIHYLIGEEELAGLERFRQLADQYGLLTAAEKASPRCLGNQQENQEQRRPHGWAVPR